MARPGDARLSDARAREAALLFEDYLERPTRARAADVLGVSVVNAEIPSGVQEIAERLYKDDSAPPLVHELADHVVSGDRDRMARALDLEPYDSRRRIARLRSILKREPRNAVRWSDLAREYLALGHVEQANRAMRLARALAPHDRFVLRSSVALLAEQDRLEEAVRLLGSADKRDPWLAAPLIAVSDLAGMKPRGIKDALTVIEEGGLPPSQVTELSAAIGSIEFAAGSDRRARRLMRQALAAPNDNALAQIVWLSDRLDAELIEVLPAEVPRTYEAFARQAAHELEWEPAVQGALSWFLDQPFSTEAAIFGSWAATEGGDWAAAVRMAEAGLQVKPDSAGLLNNLALARAEQGDLERAVDLLRRARGADATPRDRAVLAATEGLTLYRAGFSELGRQRYETAIRVFQRAKSRPLAARAAAMVAREEIMIDSPDAVDCMKRARRLVQGVSDPSIVRRVELLDHIAHPSGYAAELAKRKAALALAVAPIASLRAHDLDED